MLRERVGNLNKNTFALGALLGLGVFLFEWEMLVTAGYPYGWDALSNMIPSLYFRSMVQSGGNPLYIPWYGGMMQWENSFFKGFYPPWIGLFVPGVPQALYLKLVLGAHYIFAGVVAYYHADRYFDRSIAVPLALLFVLPMAFFNAHLSKTIAWPWMILGAFQLVSLYRDRHTPKWTGLLIGVSGGAILLTANAYYAVYLGALTATVLVAKRAWRVAGYAAAGTVVALPKVLSLVPILLEGGRDARVGYQLTPSLLVNGLTGVWWKDGPRIGYVLDFEAFAVVGLPVCLLATATLGWAYVEPARFDANWVTGIAGGGIVALLLATAWKGFYRLPLVSNLRTTRRAIIILGLGALLLSVVFLSETRDLSPRFRQAMVVLLVLSTLNAAAPLVQQSNETVEPTVGRDVAGSIEQAGCDSAYVEIGHNGTKAPYLKQKSFGLAEAGIPATAISYAKIGQQYSTHDQNGNLTFDALILPAGTSLPEDGTVELTGGWGYPSRGNISTSQFAVLDSVSTPEGEMRIYAPGGRCV